MQLRVPVPQLRFSTVYTDVYADKYTIVLTGWLAFASLVVEKVTRTVHIDSACSLIEMRAKLDRAKAEIVDEMQVLVDAERGSEDCHDFMIRVQPNQESTNFDPNLLSSKANGMLNELPEIEKEINQLLQNSYKETLSKKEVAKTILNALRGTGWSYADGALWMQYDNYPEVKRLVEKYSREFPINSVEIDDVKLSLQLASNYFLILRTTPLDIVKLYINYNFGKRG